MAKNIVLFVFVSAAILGGWIALQPIINPSVEKKIDDAKKADTPAEKKDAVVEVKKDIEPKKDKEPEKKVEPKPAAVVQQPDPPADAKSFTLGDEGSFLNVVVTSRGAGIRKLSFTRFKGANSEGHPTNKDLEFIQDDPIMPSFLMHHFADSNYLDVDGKLKLDDKGNPKMAGIDAGPPLRGLGETNWNLEGDGVAKDGEAWKIAFSTLVPDQPHLKIVKTYRLKPKDYHIGLTLEIQHVRDSGQGKSRFRYQLEGAHGLPIEGEWYTPATNFRSVVVGHLDSGGNLTRAVEDSNRISTQGGGAKVLRGPGHILYAGVMTQYFASVLVVDPIQPDGDWKKLNPLDWARPSHETTEMKAKLLMFDDDSVRFAFKIDEKTDRVMDAKILPRVRDQIEKLKLKAGDLCVVSVYGSPLRKESVVAWIRKGQTPLPYFDDVTVRANSDVLSLAPGDKVTHQYLLYHGPVKTKLLGQFTGDKAVEQKLVDLYTYDLHLRRLTDYHSDNPVGYFFSRIGWTGLLIAVTGLMHWLLDVLHYVAFGNYGVAIILLTVIVRGALFPISRKQAMMSQKMQELQPELKKLNEKFKADPKAKAAATFELYRKHKINPVGAGCLPLMLQMPIFLGLYYALQESIHFRLASFLWIDSLSAPDMLFRWGESLWSFSDPDNIGTTHMILGLIPCPFLGPYFNLLPMIAVTVMMLQQKMLMPPPQNEEQEMQQKVMKYMMPLMGIFFYKIASGLALYFIASSLWGIAERKLLPKKKPAAEMAAVDAVKTVTTAKDRRRERDRDRDRAKNEPATSVEKLKTWWQNLLDSASKK